MNPLSDTAQGHLAALRREVESRLAALEQVLADPSRGESLAGLILDLSRVATDEAQAAASQACLATKAAADKEVSELRTSAKTALEAAQTALKSATAALEQERATSADLRTAVEQTQLELRKQADGQAAREQLEAKLKSGREQLEAEAARHQAAAADLQRAAAAAQHQLETERAAAKAANDAISAELAREREAAAGRARALADAEAQLQAERTAGAELRRTLEGAEARAAALERQHAEAHAVHEAFVANLAREREVLAANLVSERDALAADLVRERDALAADLAREREACADCERAYGEIQSQLDVERATTVDLRRVAERAVELTATLGRETTRDQGAEQQAAAELAHARKEAAAQQKALAQAQKSLGAAQKELEVERAKADELRQAVESAEQLLSSARSSEVQALANLDQLSAERERERADAARAFEALAAERNKVAVELQAAQKWIDELRAADAEFAAPMIDSGPQPAVPAKSPAKTAAPAKATKTAPDEEWQAVRIADRYGFKEPLDVKINADPGKLVDISITGCQLWFPSALKPDQVVKVQLSSDKPPLTCTGKVVWTRLEPPAAGRPLGYRAGVAFTKADGDAVEAFVARHRSA